MINDQGLTTTYSRATRRQPSLTPTAVGEVPCTGQVRESYHSGVPVPGPGKQHVDQNSYFSRLRNARAVVLSPLGSSALDKAALELPRKQGVAVLGGEIQPGRR